MERLISALGLVAMIGFAWLLSAHRSKLSLRILVGGLGLQFALAFLVLRTTAGRLIFDRMGNVFNTMLSCVDEGCLLVFGTDFRDHFVAFQVLPTIIVFSSLMSVLYYLGVIQWLVQAAAWLMQKTLRTSGAESLSAAANIFVGQTEAPLVVRPYVNSMTESELMSLMVGGFATIAGGVMVAYMGMGIDPGHLITASVISAPAALLIAKVLQPEVEEPQTLGMVRITVEREAINVIDAAARGTLEGLKLALNVGAMLITFVALVAIVNAVVGWVGDLFRVADPWTLQRFFGFLFYPFAWLMGIPANECALAGEMLGTKVILNELLAYEQLGQIVKADEALPAGAARQLSDRSVTILTYALCGFANLSSIGIQLGGIGGIAPDRRPDLARLGFRAMLGGTLAGFMTACVAGILL